MLQHCRRHACGESALAESVDNFDSGERNRCREVQGVAVRGEPSPGRGELRGREKG